MEAPPNTEGQSIVSPFSALLSNPSNPALLKDDSKLWIFSGLGGPIANRICMILVMRVLAEKRKELPRRSHY
jgi:hypothetical protein